MKELEETVDKLKITIETDFKQKNYFQLVFNLGKVFYHANAYLREAISLKEKEEIFKYMKKLEPFFLEKQQLFLELSKNEEDSPLKGAQDLQLALLALEDQQKVYYNHMQDVKKKKGISSYKISKKRNYS